MYERAFRLPVGRPASAGVVVIALALYGSFIAHPAMAQNYGRPSVTVDDSVLDQLGPPPQSLPDVLLMQQPPTNRPAPGNATASPTQGRLLPPPPVMPQSRLNLPGELKQMLPEGSPASRPQTARAPRAAPVPKVERSLPPTPPAVAAAPREPSVVPPTITPPTVSVPEAPAVAPPPAPPTLPTPEIAAHAPAAETPAPPAAAPPVAKTEMPKAPPAAPDVPKIVPPAPPEAATAEPSKPEKTAMPETAAAPTPPAVEPPAPPAPTPNVAAKAPMPHVVRPVPQVAETPSEPKAESEGAAGSEPASQGQLASLPPPGKPEILENGEMYRIPFGSASSDISDEGKKYLNELSQRLKKNDALRLQLLGYAGSTQDSASKARRTSLFRALSVRTYLMKQGIRSTRMDVRALGNLAEGGAPDRVDAVIRK